MPVRDGREDFDFLIGDWSVHHRRLRQRLAGDDFWIEFTGAAAVRKILRGLGNVDEFDIPLPGDPFVGATFRLFDPASQRWSIYWAETRAPVLGPPVVGHFLEGRGLFYGEDTFDGKPIRVRFIWTPLTQQQCTWEQAFSLDDGRSWETNWMMSLTRT